MSENKRHRCPSCGKGDELWEGVMVSGYYEVDERLARTGGAEVDHTFTEEDGRFGCSCGWEGFRAGLIVLGTDDKPLPFVDPRQLKIEVP